MTQGTSHKETRDSVPHLKIAATTGCASTPPSPQPGHEEVGQAHLLSGWGRTSPSASNVVTPHDVEMLAELLTSEGPPPQRPLVPALRMRDEARGFRNRVIARGLGRSYGDAAQCAGGTVIDTSNFDSIGVIDPATGSVEVGSGASLDALIRDSLPSGWFIPVSPGTRQVTLGGAIAADVHGKNHHLEGSFCSHVSSLTLATPVGVLTITPESDPELFWATAGGMGLTGIIVKATLRLLRIETAWVEVDTERFNNLDDAMSAMVATDHLYRYSVAWIDCSAHRGGLGRSVLTRGDHAPLNALDSKFNERPLSLPRDSPKRVPFTPPRSFVNSRTSRAFNEAWFRKSPRRRCGDLVALTSFLHPLDGVANWNLLYGKRGFVQYQFAVAPRHAEVVRAAISMIAESGIASPMAVLKRFGPGTPGPLSFPIEGWTLAIDFPVGPVKLPSLLDRLDELIAGVDGRVYLAKDARLRPELMGVMYPRLGELAAVRRRVDPNGILESDLSRRLGLTGGRNP
jgi:decaprenylphospho-beta-D-ribofuranose 2-oxidase